MEWGGRGVKPPLKRAVIIDLSVNVYNLHIANTWWLGGSTKNNYINYGIQQVGFNVCIQSIHLLLSMQKCIHSVLLNLCVCLNVHDRVSKFLCLIINNYWRIVINITNILK